MTPICKIYNLDVTIRISYERGKPLRYTQLRAFHHVAVEGGFSRAAQVLRLTQPAISDQVRRLEVDHDVRLFDRGHRQVRLTNAGRQLLEITHRLFDAELQARELLSEAQVTAAGRLRIIADSALHLRAILPAFGKRFPAVRIEIRSGNSREVIAALGAYTADLGVTGDEPETGSLMKVSLGRSPLVAYSSVDHPAARAKSTTLKHLAGLSLVLRETGSRTRRLIEQAANKHKVALTPAIEAEGREAVTEIVAAGFGVGLISEAEFPRDPRLAMIPLAGTPPVMEETLVCLKERRNNRLIAGFMGLAGEIASR